MPPEFLAIIARTLRAKFPPPAINDPLSLVDEKGRANLIRQAAHQEVIRAFEDATNVQRHRLQMEGV